MGENNTKTLKVFDTRIGVALPWTTNSHLTMGFACCIRTAQDEGRSQMEFFSIRMSTAPPIDLAIPCSHIPNSRNSTRFLDTKLKKTKEKKDSTDEENGRHHHHISRVPMNYHACGSFALLPSAPRRHLLQTFQYCNVTKTKKKR